jgi:signal transduction histidine kinase
VRSLSSRLLSYCIAGSLLAYFSTPATVQIPLAFFNGVDHRQALEVWTTKRARAIVVEALRRGGDGALEIEMTPALRAHLDRNPNLRFAAFIPKTGEIIRGSSREIVAPFQAVLGNVEIFGSLFHLAHDPNETARGYIRTTVTPYGRLGTIVYGANFHWDDVLYQLRAYIVAENLLAWLLLGAVLSIIIVLAVRSGLAPLKLAAARASQIDVDSLGVRLSDKDMPSEVRPFIEAVNAAFSRVDQGVARQKRFTANSAHELRTPIAILNARIERLDDCAIKRDLQRDASRITTLLEQLLVLAQIEERGARDETRELDLGATLLETIADYMPLAFASGTKIDFDVSDTPVLVRAHRWAVESVVTNLLDNAIRAEPAGGVVVLRLREPGLVQVIDHGAGIAREDQDAIFEPFWRKSDAAPGAGLGLAIARELMERQGGRIWVEDTPGGGAIFNLSFARSFDAACSPAGRR